MKKVVLTAAVFAFAAVLTATQAFAITSGDLSGRMWIFDMQVSSDGEMIDTGNTTMFNNVFTKTEVKDMLKSITKTMISYDNFSIFRLTDDSLYVFYFDSHGFSLYGYKLPTKISPVE